MVISEQAGIALKAMDTFDKHQIAIAKKTLRLSDAGAAILGGMTKAQAREILQRLAGWSDKRIEAFED